MFDDAAPLFAIVGAVFELRVPVVCVGGPACAVAGSPFVVGGILFVVRGESYEVRAPLCAFFRSARVWSPVRCSAFPVACSLFGVRRSASAYRRSKFPRSTC